MEGIIGDGPALVLSASSLLLVGLEGMILDVGFLEIIPIEPQTVIPPYTPY